MNEAVPTACSLALPEVSYPGEEGAKMPLRILLAEGHEIVRRELKKLLVREGFAVVAEAANGLMALRLARQARPDVAVLDYSMPGLNGPEVARQMLSSCPATPTLILSLHEEAPYVWDALRAGVRGYVLKRLASSDLPLAIRQVAQGGVYLSTPLAGFPTRLPA